MAGIELKGFKLIQGLDNLKTDSTKKVLSGSSEIYSISVHKLNEGRYQPRLSIKQRALEELAASIKTHGILQPLIVRKKDSESYEIIAGERRWKAAKLAGLEEVPVILRDIPNETALAFALIENIQREDLNPIDQAFALSRLKEEFSMTHDEISKVVGRPRSTITNLLRLLLLDDEVKQMLKDDKIEVGHAKSLLSLKYDQQIGIACKIIEQKLTVRDTEDLVQKMKNSQKPSPDLKNKIKELSEQMASKLASAVSINLNKKGGYKIKISVNSIEDIIRLVHNINTKV